MKFKIWAISVLLGALLIPISAPSQPGSLPVLPWKAIEGPQDYLPAPEGEIVLAPGEVIQFQFPFYMPDAQDIDYLVTVFILNDSPENEVIQAKSIPFMTRAAFAFCYKNEECRSYLFSSSGVSVTRKIGETLVLRFEFKRIC